MLAQNMAKLIITLPEKPFQKKELDFFKLIQPTNHYYGN
jgi:hypothetical protein